jgi:dTDP-L-rhamnose 4-epimerase
MKKILITGGAGFIGSHLALQLLHKGHDLTVLDNLSPQVHGFDPANTSPLYKSIKDKLRFIKGDVTNSEDWKNAIGDNELIVHLAAETGTGQSMYQVSRYIDTNMGGTAVLLDILANQKTKVHKLLVASSRAIYGEGKYLTDDKMAVYPGNRKAADMDRGIFEVSIPGINGPLQVTATDEESRIHPSSVYGITKQNQEQLVMLVGPSLGINAVALRFQNVYGPGQSLSNPYTGILSIFSSLIKNHKPVNIFEDGKESRDFIFINDAVHAMMLAVEKPEADNQVFNVGTGIPVTVMEVAKTLKKHYGIEVPLHVTGNYRLGDIRHNYADIRKIKEQLGFQPLVNFEEGAQRFAEWVDQQPVMNSKFDESIRELKEKGLMK